MAHRDTIRFAAFALLFTMGACAASLDTPENIAPIPPVTTEPEPAPGTPEFHGASIGRDTLRSRLQSEN